MEEKGLKITLAVIQSFLVIVLAYLLSFVRETEIVNTSVIILFILHFVVTLVIMSVIFLKGVIYLSLSALQNISFSLL